MYKFSIYKFFNLNLIFKLFSILRLMLINVQNDGIQTSLALFLEFDTSSPQNVSLSLSNVQVFFIALDNFSSIDLHYFCLSNRLFSEMTFRQTSNQIVSTVRFLSIVFMISRDSGDKGFFHLQKLPGPLWATYTHSIMAFEKLLRRGDLSQILINVNKTYDVNQEDLRYSRT